MPIPPGLGGGAAAVVTGIRSESGGGQVKPGIAYIPVVLREANRSKIIVLTANVLAGGNTVFLISEPLSEPWILKSLYLCCEAIDVGAFAQFGIVYKGATSVNDLLEGMDLIGQESKSNLTPIKRLPFFSSAYNFVDLYEYIDEPGMCIAVQFNNTLGAVAHSFMLIATVAYDVETPEQAEGKP